MCRVLKQTRFPNTSAICEQVYKSAQLAKAIEDEWLKLQYYGKSENLVKVRVQKLKDMLRVALEIGNRARMQAIADALVRKLGHSEGMRQYNLVHMRVFKLNPHKNLICWGTGKGMPKVY